MSDKKKKKVTEFHPVKKKHQVGIEKNGTVKFADGTIKKKKKGDD